MESVELTGPALYGALQQIPISVPRGPGGRKALTVKLGRRKGEAPENVPKLAAFLGERKGKPIPSSVDWGKKAAKSLSQMYANDREGCCVISGKGHHIGVWTSNDADSGGEVVGTNQEILSQYHTICGPGDNGCYIPAVLDVMMRKGLTLGGKPHKIAGYCSVDWKNREQLQTAIHLFGGVTFGINLPAAWTSAAIWDVTDTRIVGGHDVAAVNYDTRGVYVSSWGRVYLMTWAACADRRFVEECYVLLGEDWTGNDKLAANGVDVTGLQKAFDVLRGGGTPDIPDGPEPPPPPPPGPPPPAPGPVVFDLAGTIDRAGLSGRGTFSGTATPQGQRTFPDDHEFDCRTPYVASVLADLMEQIDGVAVTLVGARLRLRRGRLAAPNWGNIIAMIMAMLNAILPFLKADGQAVEQPDDQPGDDQPGDDQPGDDQPGDDEQDGRDRRVTV
jgi:hypothetical protein